MYRRRIKYCSLRFVSEFGSEERERGKEGRKVMTRARSDKRERTTRVYFVHAVSLLDRFVAGLDRIVLGPGYLSRTDRGRGRERGPEDDAPSKTYSIVAPSFPLILRPRGHARLDNAGRPSRWAGGRRDALLLLLKEQNRHSK